MIELARKKPIEVEVWFWGGAEGEEALIELWLGDAFESWVPSKNELIIHTNTGNGEVVVHRGEYIIKGVEGEFYPCPLGVFRKSYDVIGRPQMSVVPRQRREVPDDWKIKR